MYCQKENPSDFSYCRYCGADIRDVPDVKGSFWKRLPAWAWIIIMVAGIGGLFFGVIATFIGVATIEGIASIILLTLGIIGFGVVPLRRPEKPSGFARAIGLGFFALMGATVDQPGNLLYNKPVEYACCPAETGLSRDETVLNPMPGTTIIQQDFTCYNKQGVAVKTINMFAVMGIRFLEYVLLGYLLIFLRQAIWRIKNNT